MANILWSDKKRPLFGLPISFTKYTLTEEKLLVDTGFLSKSQEEIRLYRITDFSVRQGLFQRMFGVGDILITSSDNLQHNFVIRDINGTPIMETLNNSSSSMYKHYLTVSNYKFSSASWIPGMSTPDLNQAAHIDDIVAAGDGTYYLSFSYKNDTNSKYAAFGTGFESGTWKYEQTFTRNPVTKYAIYWCSIAAADPTYDTYIYDGKFWTALGPIDTTGGNE